MNEDGEPAPLEDTDEALERWKAIWDMGRIPEKPVCDYLESQIEKFWLFHPERPFYQVPKKDFPKKGESNKEKLGTEYGAKKLNGQIYEGENKLRLFPAVNGLNKNKLSYGEAARWLISLHAFDDSSVKPMTKKGEKSAGIGWMGKIGPIVAKGNNLFETLMLNFVMPTDKERLGKDEKPCWELEKVISEESVPISVPDNLSELYTLQSRRILLKREADGVVGYNLLSGSFFEKENALIEQMTTWKPIPAKTKDKSVIGYEPLRHDSAKQMWREFPSTFLLGEHEKARSPGIVKWVSEVKYDELIDTAVIVKFEICSAQYDSKNASITDVFSDSLLFHKKLLEETNEGWRSAIADEVAKCDQLATAVYHLANDIDAAMGEDEGKSYVNAKEQLYFRIDIPFRKWLESINSEWGTEESEADRKRWRETAQKIAIALGEEMVANAGENAFTGRIIKDDKTTRCYSSAKALLNFKYNVRKIYD